MVSNKFGHVTGEKIDDFHTQRLVDIAIIPQCDGLPNSLPTVIDAIKIWAPATFVSCDVSIRY